ncbi:hypothetical protein [Lactococcus formosensis]|uniref:hypothetical protein n=1 Tax=Lactococcus formosensis TaxID=1281486 RepID=UPI0024356C95|nr:hypothetical protein [Lactococcus formosensis]MDG6120828.1 hypothetical protein [Lactococcus formosensis]
MNKKIWLLVILLGIWGTISFAKPVQAVEYNEASANHVAMSRLGNYINSKLLDSLSDKTLGYVKGDSISFNIFDSGKNRLEAWVEQESSSLDANMKYSGYVYIPNDAGVLSGNSYDGTINMTLNSQSGDVTITRIKNKLTQTADPSVNIPFSYLFTAWSYTLGWWQVNDRAGSGSFDVSPTISLEDAPELKIEPKSEQFDMPTEIPDTPESYIQVSQRMKDSTLKYEWITKPESRMRGEEIQQAEAKVTDTLGEYVHTKTITLNFKNNRLSAEEVPQNINLGMDDSMLDFSKFVKNVKLGNQPLSSEDYTVELLDDLSTDTVGEKTAKVRVTLKSDTSKAIELEVPVIVGWGNSIAYRAYDIFGDGRTVAAFPLLDRGEKLFIVASQGQHDDNEQIHAASGSIQSGDNYYAFDWFDMLNQTEPKKLDDSVGGNKSIAAKASDHKKDKLKEWGEKQEVHIGDVVRAWHYEESKVDWYHDGGKQPWAGMSGIHSIYYEITKDGYRSLHFNHLKPKKDINIPIYTTTEDLDKNISDYIDLNGNTGVSVKGFSKYPDTTISGEQKGTIVVEESLTTGKKIQYEYEVTFTVGEGDLSLSVPKKLTFNEFTKSKDEQVIQRKYSGNLGLAVKDSRGRGKQGNWRVTAKVDKTADLAPYLIFRDDNSQDEYLSQGATIYSQEKQADPTDPLNIEISGQWTKDKGIFLKVPSKNKLLSKTYSTVITWNLVEGP